jgi:hypothetical protein
MSAGNRHGDDPGPNLTPCGDTPPPARTASAGPQLDFDAATHTYRAGGVVIPSVTQVLEDVGIIDYSYIPWPTRQMALARGSAVHLATQFYDEGDLDEGTLTVELAGFLEAWKRFLDETGFVIEANEHRGYVERYGYAGTLDRVGRFERMVGLRLKIDGPVLLDIKTNDAPWWVAIQTAAYAAFFPDPGSYRRIAVELHGDGTCGVIEFPCADWQRDYNLFLCALSVYQAKRRQKA